MYGMRAGYSNRKRGGSMNGSVAKALRKMAYNDWVVLSEEAKNVITIRMVYRNLKDEYKNRRK